MTTDVMNVSLARGGITYSQVGAACVCVCVCVCTVCEGWAGAWLWGGEVSKHFVPPCSVTFLMAEGPQQAGSPWHFQQLFMHTLIHQLNMCKVSGHALYVQYMKVANPLVQFAIESIQLEVSVSIWLLNITPEQAVCGEAEKKKHRGSTYDDIGRVFTATSLRTGFIQDLLYLARIQNRT